MKKTTGDALKTNHMSGGKEIIGKKGKSGSTWVKKTAEEKKKRYYKKNSHERRSKETRIDEKSCKTIRRDSEKEGEVVIAQI